MSPKFSIILPTFNRAYVLWRAVESVLAQTHEDWELIVVDDGSTDCTQRLLEEFRDPRIQNSRMETNKGPSAARNHGLTHARAPWIAYIDSDNTWHPDFLETMQGAIRGEEDTVLWYCGQNTVFWERSKEGDWRKIEERRETRRQLCLEDVWQLEGADANCIVHRSSLADEIGGWDENCRWLEDWDFFLRAFLRYPKAVKWAPKVLVEYRQVHGSGADGIAAEAREDGYAEIAGRRYLLGKWKGHTGFAAKAKLEMTIDDLCPFTVLSRRDIRG